MEQGAREIVMVSRSGPCDYQKVYEHQDADVIVNATPVGMYPDCMGRPVDLARFPALSGVLDVVYNPLRTRLIQQAQALSLRCAGGLAMLAAQARAAEEVFFEKRLSETELTLALAQMRRELTNIILIGMPGSGKTTLGTLTAQALSRELMDTDQMIQKEAGMPVPEIFERFGEEKFRELEEKAVLSACEKGGRVVAVGGGAVLSESNRAAMRLNGRIYLIDRPLEKLDRTGRPLSKSTQVLEKMRERRAPLYQALCDKTIDNSVPPETAARVIKEDFDAYSGH
jgi:shikimate dehydrogenase